MITLSLTHQSSATFKARGIPYRVSVIDDELKTDPTVLIFRENEEIAVATIHLTPGAECVAAANTSHVVVRGGEA